MSSLEAFNQVNYLPSQSVQYSTMGYGSIGISVAGTLGDDITAEGSNDGHTWEELPIAKGGAQVTDNEIVTTGSYTISTVDYALVRLVTGGSFTGPCTVSATISTRVPAPFTVGF